MDKRIPPAIETSLRSWHFHLQIWWFVHRFLQIVGLVCSITVPSKLSFIPKDNLAWSIVAWVAAVCMGLLAGIKPATKARAYHAAWRKLRDATDRYITIENYSAEELLNCRAEAWKKLDLGD